MDLPTADHQLITVELSNNTSPEIGCGRWAIPKYLINNTEFLGETEKIGRDALMLMTDTQHSTHLDPQLVFQAYLQVIRNLAKQLKQVKSGKMNSTLQCLRKRRDNAERKVNPHNLRQTEAVLAQIKAITATISEVEHMHYTKTKSSTRANKRLFAETMNQYWCGWGKEKKSKDTIKEMRSNNSMPAEYTMDSNKMAEIATNHYNSVQD